MFMLYVEIVKEAGVNVVCRGEAFGRLKATNASKRLFTQFLMYSWLEVFFFSISVFFWRKGKCLSSVTIGVFFFQTAIIFATNFLWTCPQKNIWIANWLLLWGKKDLKLKLKEDEIIGGKKESYFRRLFGTVHGKQNISKVLYTFFVWSMKSIEKVC